MDNNFIHALLSGNNLPPQGKIIFDSTDHVRFQNGIDVSGHNVGCNRRITIESNINGEEGYTVTMYNLDGLHPLWQNNVQMAPKQMRIVNIDRNIVALRGFGHDAMGASFSDYGILLMVEDDQIIRIQLDMYDRNVSIVYVK